MTPPALLRHPHQQHAPHLDPSSPSSSVPPNLHHLLAFTPTIAVLMRRDGPACWICHALLPPTPPHKFRHPSPSPSRDHVIPRIHSPNRHRLDLHWNLRPACNQCNSQKGSIVPHWAHLRWDLLAPNSPVPPTIPELDLARRACRRIAIFWSSPLPPALAHFLDGGPAPYPYALYHYLPP